MKKKGRKKRRKNMKGEVNIPKPRLKDYKGKMIERISSKGRKDSRIERKEFKAKVKKMIVDY